MKDANNVLRNSELNQLKGKNNINLKVLILFITLTLLGFGHSIGGVLDLKKRMDNPFTRWVNLPIPSSADDFKKAEEMLQYLSQENIKNSFFLDTILGYRRDFLRFTDRKGIRDYFATVRTIDPEESLLDEILKKNNIIKDHRESIYEDCWIIIKQDFAEKLNFGESADSLFTLELKQGFNLTLDVNLFVPVLAVVKDLPDMVDAILPEHFYELLFRSYDATNLLDLGMTNRIDFLSSKKLSFEHAQSYFNLDTDSIYVEAFSQNEYLLNKEKWFLSEVFLSKPLPFGEKLELVQALSKNKPDEFKIYTEHNCDNRTSLYIENPGYLAFTFNRLTKVRELRDFVKSEYLFEITLNQVEDKDNFAKVALLTTILSIILFAISLSGIVFFLIKILLSHFDKIQTNLGTFKAFGLDNNVMIVTYVNILRLFFLQAFLYSAVLTGMYWIFTTLVNLNFSLLHWSVPISFVVLSLLIRFVVINTIKKRLSKTPGDLIYNR